ncbi:MAG: hypothetical protein M1371_04515 [Actinobacteria bacterium]|nr:hypothetical protein [Actinomycetota bacterium]
MFRKRRNYTKLILLLVLLFAALAIASPFVINKIRGQSQASQQKKEIDVVETEHSEAPISLNEAYFAVHLQDTDLLKIQSDTVSANQDIFYVISYSNGTARDRIEIKYLLNGGFRGITLFRPATATGTRTVLVSQADQNVDSGEIRVTVSVNQKFEKDELLFLSSNSKNEVRYINYNNQTAGLSFEYPEFLLVDDSTPGMVVFKDIRSSRTFLDLTLIPYDGAFNPDGLLDWYFENKTKQNFNNINQTHRGHYSVGPVTGAEMEFNATSENGITTVILFAFNTTSYYVVFDFQISEKPGEEEIDTVKNVLNNIIVSAPQ